MRRLARFFSSFLCFAILVFLPIIYDGLILLALDVEERHIGAGLLKNSSALAGLIWSILLWFVIYFLFYWICHRLYRRIAVLLKLDSVLLDALFVCLLAIFVYSFGVKFFPVSGYSYVVSFIYFYEYVVWCGLAFLFIAACFELKLSLGFRCLSLGMALVFLLPGSVVFFNQGEVVSYDKLNNDPNIFIVGVDSLSAAAFEKHREDLVSLSLLVAQGDLYTRAYTNLGRTYPAWVTLLTGLYPSDHGAIFNLRDVAVSSPHPNLVKTLSSYGYHTVYAMDERRFSNLDESFGFNETVGPRIGAIDFIVQPLFDTPITNFVLQWGGAKYLFPWTWNNVAAYSSYSKDAFVDDVLNSTKVGVPNFVAVHFETAHFPFRSRYAAHHFDHENEWWGRYISALKVVDSQVGRYMKGLEERGLLNNALVILFSDHGEGLGEIEAMYKKESEERVVVSSYGHGADLLSDHQNRILLAAVRFEEGRAVGGAKLIDNHVSIVDVKPAIERLMNDGKFNVSSDGECFIVETGIRLASASDYHALDEKEVAREAASFYRIDEAGRLVLRERSVYKLAARKDVGWRCPNRLTWYDYAKNEFLSVRLGADGLPLGSLTPDAQDIDEIRNYQFTYLMNE